MAKNGDEDQGTKDELSSIFATLDLGTLSSPEAVFLEKVKERVPEDPNFQLPNDEFILEHFNASKKDIIEERKKRGGQIATSKQFYEGQDIRDLVGLKLQQAKLNNYFLETSINHGNFSKNIATATQEANKRRVPSLIALNIKNNHWTAMAIMPAIDDKPPRIIFQDSFGKALDAYTDIKIFKDNNYEILNIQAGIQKDPARDQDVDSCGAFTVEALNLFANKQDFNDLDVVTIRREIEKHNDEHNTDQESYRIIHTNTLKDSYNQIAQETEEIQETLSAPAPDLNSFFSEFVIKSINTDNDNTTTQEAQKDENKHFVRLRNALFLSTKESMAFKGVKPEAGVNDAGLAVKTYSKIESGEEKLKVTLTEMPPISSAAFTNIRNVDVNVEKGPAKVRLVPCGADGKKLKKFGFDLRFDASGKLGSSQPDIRLAKFDGEVAYIEQEGYGKIALPLNRAQVLEYQKQLEANKPQIKSNIAEEYKKWQDGLIISSRNNVNTINPKDVHRAVLRELINTTDNNIKNNVVISDKMSINLTNDQLEAYRIIAGEILKSKEYEADREKVINQYASTKCGHITLQESAQEDQNQKSDQNAQENTKDLNRHKAIADLKKAIHEFVDNPSEHTQDEINEAKKEFVKHEGSLAYINNLEKEVAASVQGVLIYKAAENGLHDPSYSALTAKISEGFQYDTGKNSGEDAFKVAASLSSAQEYIDNANNGDKLNGSFRESAIRNIMIHTHVTEDPDKLLSDLSSTSKKEISESILNNESVNPEIKKKVENMGQSPRKKEKVSSSPKPVHAPGSPRPSSSPKSRKPYGR